MDSHDNNRFAPPTAAVADVDTTGELQLGGRGARLGAVMIDGLIQSAVTMALAFTLIPALRPTLAASGRAGFGATLGLSILVGVLLFLAINGYLLATQGQTVGKRLVGLRIVRSDGERASFGRLFGLRYLIGLVVMMVPVVGGLYAMIDSLLIFRDSRQCLHDNIADTVVVKA